MKKCTDCEIPKPLTEFYRQADRKDNHRGECKKCHSKKGWKNSLARLDDYNAQRTGRRREDPRKHKARQAVQDHIKLGDLVRPEKCSKCHKGCKPEAHHADYSKQLDIEWLCTTCHGEWHQHNKAA